MAENEDNETRLRRLARELRDSDDDEEITAEHLIDAMKAGAAIVNETGKHRALGPDEPTPTDPHRKAVPTSSPPKSGFAKLKLFDPARIDTAPKAFAFLVLVVAVVVLAIFGPEWVRNVVP